LERKGTLAIHSLILPDQHPHLAADRVSRCRWSSALPKLRSRVDAL
jgi:hypothetical protein